MAMTIGERTRIANEKAERFEHQQRVDARNEREARKRKDKRRYYILGEFIAKHFPEVKRFEPGKNKNENAVVFEEFDTALSILATDQEVMDWLKHEVRRRLSLKEH